MAGFDCILAWGGSACKDYFTPRNIFLHRFPLTAYFDSCKSIRMTKEIRFNANKINSANLRKIQKIYNAKASPTKISLDALANLSIEYGYYNVVKKLNLETEYDLAK